MIWCTEIDKTLHGTQVSFLPFSLLSAVILCNPPFSILGTSGLIIPRGHRCWEKKKGHPSFLVSTILYIRDNLISAEPIVKHGYQHVLKSLTLFPIYSLFAPPFHFGMNAHGSPIFILLFNISSPLPASLLSILLYWVMSPVGGWCSNSFVCIHYGENVQLWWMALDRALSL